MKRIYVETFDAGPQGWFGWINNIQGPKALEVRNSAIISRSPWWIDYNHAPPGAGYLHLLFALNTGGGDAYSELYLERAGLNRFLEEQFPTDFSGARLTCQGRNSQGLPRLGRSSEHLAEARK